MRQRRRRPLTTAIASAVGALTAVAPAAHADPLKIHVRGTAQLTATLSSEGNTAVVDGTLVDDAAVPIARGRVTLQLLGADGAPLALPAPAPCGAHAATPHANGPKEYAIDTDDAGQFCVRAPGVTAASARARFAATKTYEGSEIAARAATAEDALRTSIRIEPGLDLIELDRDVIPFAASLRIQRPEPTRSSAEAVTKREGLHVVVEDERHRTIADEVTGGDGRARFELRPAQLGDAGPGELHIRFAGAPGLAPSEDVEPVIRRAAVSLTLARPVAPGHPDDGIPIEVDVRSQHGAVSGGVIEALRGSESVGAGNVVDGHARVLATFAADRASTVGLTLRYVAAAPWWRPGPELSVEVRTTGPGVLKRLLLALGVVAAAAWVVGGWRRAPKPPRTRETATAPPSGRAGVEVLAAADDMSGWRGTVVDAHDAAPIADAELTIVVPTFEGSGVVARALTDATGAFVLELGDAPRPSSGARLVVSSPFHTMHEQPIVPPSVLRVALVSRRRALIERLVRWARRQGAPFDASPDPTPGHVRRTAARTNADAIEDWAGRVEEAAFGVHPIDEAAERGVVAAEPNKPV